MRPALTRSPAYVLTLVAGVLVAFAGWAVATLFDQTIVAATADVQEAIRVLPVWMETAPGVVTSGGVVAALAAVHVWLLGHRRFRRLALADAAFVAGVVASVASAALLRSVLSPQVRSLFVGVPEDVARSAPTSPAMAGLVGVLVMTRQWLPVRVRPAAYCGSALLLLTHLAVVDAPPYLGIVLDVGVGMVSASLVALLARTPNLQPDRRALVRGLAESGLEVAELHTAAVDARGSEPWIGATPDGQPVFVKALSTDQRAADLLFRAVRWLRLRRTGDAPPEASLRRAVEHEALIAHHARSVGVSTPRVLAVANVGTKKVALAYEGVIGHSLDAVAPEAVTDAVVEAIWTQVRRLRAHRIAHRDLRLANVFLADDGRVLLIDFGFAELAASQQLLDTDVAELVVATSAVVGPERAVRIAAGCLGEEALEQARDWLHPLALTTATRHAIASTCGLEAVREAANRATGHTVRDYERLGRLSPSRILALVLGGVGVYSLLALVVHPEIATRTSGIDPQLLAAAVAVGMVAPVVGAVAYRAATDRRVPVRSLWAAAFAAETPVSAPTAWSFANRILSDAARDHDLQAVTAKQAASDRCMAALIGAPLLVAGFAAAGFSVEHGQVVGVALGLGAGATVALAEFLATLSPSGRELRRVWLRPFRTRGVLTVQVVLAFAWMATAITAQGAAFALAARAGGVGTRPELLIALGIAAIAVATLTSVPGGIGAVELLTGAGLLVDNDFALAALGAVLGRIALFWAPLPVALWAYRSTRHHRDHASLAGFDDPAPEPAVSARIGDPSAADRIWWT